MRRRDLVTLVGGAVMAWPLAARAEQPVIGILATASAEANAARLRAFHEGLRVAGYVKDNNVKIDYRWAEEGRYDQLPTMAADLVDRRVSVIFASPIPAALAAKATTATTPIVFAIGNDPIETGPRT